MQTSLAISLVIPSCLCYAQRLVTQTKSQQGHWQPTTKCQAGKCHGQGWHFLTATNFSLPCPHIQHMECPLAMMESYLVSAFQRETWIADVFLIVSITSKKLYHGSKVCIFCHYLSIEPVAFVAFKHVCQTNRMPSSWSTRARAKNYVTWLSCSQHLWQDVFFFQMCRCFEHCFFWLSILAGYRKSFLPLQCWFNWSFRFWYFW